MFGDNIKVHFAGTEQIHHAYMAYRAGVKYFLFTCFPFICREFGISGFPITCKNAFPPAELAKFSKHTIMDSGLFTLMFGAHAGKRDRAFIEKWMYALANFAIENKIKATCVEVDCQKVLGPEQAWEFRTKLKEILPNHQINVFHYEDGKYGLDRLIEFSDYIAISVPELRIIHRKTFKEDVYKLASYIKEKKPEIDIHLLGCTQKDLLIRCKFCSTSDSTSWLSGQRFGRIFGNHIRGLKKEYFGEAEKAVIDMSKIYGIELNARRMESYKTLFCASTLHKQQYAAWCGSQE